MHKQQQPIVLILTWLVLQGLLRLILGESIRLNSWFLPNTAYTFDFEWWMYPAAALGVMLLAGLVIGIYQLVAAGIGLVWK